LLKYDQLVSNFACFAFNFNIRPSTKENIAAELELVYRTKRVVEERHMVRWCCMVQVKLSLNLG
jgi:hypothetical protein